MILLINYWKKEWYKTCTGFPLKVNMIEIHERVALEFETLCLYYTLGQTLLQKQVSLWIYWVIKPIWTDYDTWTPLINVLLCCCLWNQHNNVFHSHVSLEETWSFCLTYMFRLTTTYITMKEFQGWGQTY